MSEIKSAPTASEDQEEVSGFTASHSLGEHLVPLLVIAMQSCLVYTLLLGLAGFHFPASDESLLPIWLPLSVGLGLYWFTQLLQRVRPIGASARFSAFRTWTPKILIMLLALFSTWLFLYAQPGPIFTLEWIQSLVNDIVELNAHFYQAIVIFVLVCYLGWRGMQSALDGIELHTLAYLRRLGLLCFSSVVLLHLLQMQLGQVSQSSLALFLLIPVFLFLLLLAQALQQVSYLRRFHAVGLQGSARRQERIILQSIGLLGGVAALMLLLIEITTQSGALTRFFAPLGALYDWLANALLQALLFIGTPIGNFLTWLLSFYHKQKLSPYKAAETACQKVFRITHHWPPHCNDAPSGAGVSSTPNFLLLLLIKIGLPVLLVSVVLFLLWRRYRKATTKHAQTPQSDGDIHESVWSWSLFLAQLKALLTAWLSLFRPFRKKGRSKAGDEMDDLGLATPEARSIREIYRAFLKKAARKGYARDRDETPYEFRHRLNTKKPLVEPQLEAITDAYTLIRYGGGLPDEQEVATICQFWNELERKWETSS